MCRYMRGNGETNVPAMTVGWWGRGIYRDLGAQNALVTLLIRNNYLTHFKTWRMPLCVGLRTHYLQAGAHRV